MSETLIVRLKDLMRYSMNAPSAHSRIGEAVQRIEELEAQVAALKSELDIAIDNQEMK